MNVLERMLPEGSNYIYICISFTQFSVINFKSLVNFNIYRSDKEFE